MEFMARETVSSVIAGVGHRPVSTIRLCHHTGHAVRHATTLLTRSRVLAAVSRVPLLSLPFCLLR
eukprot:7879514-Pyramimonas_sp.AAC.1